MAGGKEGEIGRQEKNPLKEREINEAELARFIEAVVREVMPAYLLPNRGQSPADPNDLSYFNPSSAFIQWVKLRNFHTHPPLGLTKESHFLKYGMDSLRDDTFDTHEEFRLILAGMALHDKLTLKYLQLKSTDTNPHDLKAAKQQLLKVCYLLEKLLNLQDHYLITRHLSRINQDLTTVRFADLIEILESQIDELTRPNNGYLTYPIDFPSASIMIEEVSVSTFERQTDQFSPVSPELFKLIMIILKKLLFGIQTPGAVRLTDDYVLKLCMEELPTDTIETQKYIAEIIIRVISNPDFTVYFAPGSIKVVAQECFE